MQPLLEIPESLQNQISLHKVPVSENDLKTMTDLVSCLHHLGCNPQYQKQIYPELPASAQFDPVHNSVMMGYDFHLTDNGPKLIEVNTNAGGAVMAWGAAKGSSLNNLSDHAVGRWIESFREEYRLFSGVGKGLSRIVIIDENPSSQFLFPEMELYVKLFAQFGIEAIIVDPTELQVDTAGVFYNGKQIDFIYNRHCDFYLETKALAAIRDAYLNRTVCLSPNPRQYGLLADKRRMIAWTTDDFVERFDLSEEDADLICRTTPKTRLLADCDIDQIWSERKKLIFKPTTGFGSRGVLAGRKISRKRFDELPPEETLAQEYCPPSTIETEDGVMKVDIRLFAYADRVLGITSRLYQGQVTNMRTPGGGFAAIEIVD